jgi:hypothetical protein
VTEKLTKLFLHIFSSAELPTQQSTVLTGNFPQQCMELMDILIQQSTALMTNLPNNSLC